MNLIVNRDITIFERAQAGSDDTWLIAALIVIGFLSVAAALLERSKLLQRSLIENEVASRLRAKEVLDKYSEASPAEPQSAIVEATPPRLPTLEEAAEALRAKREAESDAASAESAMAAPEHEEEEQAPKPREMFQVRTPDGRLIMIPVRGPDVPEEVSDQDWIDFQIEQHDNPDMR